MQLAWSRIWTRVIVSMSYDDNHYTTGTWLYPDGWFSRLRLTAPQKISNFKVELDQTLHATPNAYKIVQLGKFNARFDPLCYSWLNVFNKLGTEKAQINCILLLSICSEHQLVITNPLLQIQQHPRSKHWYLIDYTIMWKRGMPNFLNPGALIETNRSTNLDITKFTSKIQGRLTMKDTIPIKELTNYIIKINRIRDDQQDTLNERLAKNSESIIKEKWNTFISIVYKVSKKKIASAVMKHEDWFDG